MKKQEIEIDKMDNFDGMTPLMLACINGNYDVIRLLVKKRANIMLKSLYGNIELLLPRIHTCPLLLL